MSKNQVFDQQGNLIEEIEIVDNLPPNITAFITQMMLDAGYQQIVLMGDSNKLARLETLMIRLENRPIVTKADLEIIKLIWDDLINSLSNKSDYINGWNELVVNNSIPFIFDSEGKIQISEDLQ